MSDTTPNAQPNEDEVEVSMGDDLLRELREQNERLLDLLLEQRETNRLLGEFVNTAQTLVTALSGFEGMLGGILGPAGASGAEGVKLPAGAKLLLKGMQRASRG